MLVDIGSEGCTIKPENGSRCGVSFLNFFSDNQISLAGKIISEPSSLDQQAKRSSVLNTGPSPHHSSQIRLSESGDSHLIRRATCVPVGPRVASTHTAKAFTEKVCASALAEKSRAAS